MILTATAKYADLKRKTISGIITISGYAPWGDRTSWSCWVLCNIFLVHVKHGIVDDNKFQYRAKPRVVQHSVHRDKIEFVITLVREVEAVADSTDFRTAYRITKELSPGRKRCDGPLTNLDVLLLIHNEMNEWNEHLTKFLVVSHPPLVYEITSHRNMWMCTALQSGPGEKSSWPSFHLNGVRAIHRFAALASWESGIRFLPEGRRGWLLTFRKRASFLSVAIRGVSTYYIPHSHKDNSWNNTGTHQETSGRLDRQRVGWF